MLSLLYGNTRFVIDHGHGVDSGLDLTVQFTVFQNENIHS